MNIQPYMIDVEYDRTIEHFDGSFAAIKQITKADPLKRYKDQKGTDVWYTYNHFYREIDRTDGPERRILQVGYDLQLNDKEKKEDIDLFLIPLYDDAEAIALDYDEESDLWFERIRFRISEDQKTKEKSLVTDQLNISGIVDAGTIQLFAIRGKVITYKALINFLPSSISEEDYNIMLTDLFRINESLFKKQSNVTIGNKKMRTAEQIASIIEQLEGPIYTINHRPQTYLSFAWQKGLYNQQSKFRMRSEIEKRMNPGKQKISVFKATKTAQIEENQIIKQELIRLQKYCDFHSEQLLIRDFHSRQSLIDIDKKQIQHEIDLNIHKLPQQIKRNLKQEGILTKENDINMHHLKQYIREQQEKQNNLNDQIKAMITPYKAMNKAYEPKENPVSIRLSTKLHKPIIRSDIQYKRDTQAFKSLYQSNYDQETNFSSLKFNGYAYADKKIPKYFSKFVTIDIETSELQTHWKFAHIFDVAMLKAKENNGDSAVEIVFYGDVIGTDPRRNDDDDIIGIPDYSGRFRRYTFRFIQLTSATIDGVEIDLTTPKEKAIDQFIIRYLANTHYEFRRLDAEQERVNHSLHFTRQLLQLDESVQQRIEDAEQFAKIARTIDDWLKLPVFRTIQTTGHERLKPTQLFLNDPHYLSVWNLLNEIDESTDLSLIPEFGDLRFGVKKVHEIYEVWILYKIVHLLTEQMGWKIENQRNAQQYFLDFISVRKSLNNFVITLTQRDWKIVLYYEPHINLRNGSHYTPDYVFQFFHQNEPVGNAYMDAKYRNYLDQGTSSNPTITERKAEKIWKQDIDETAIQKYGHIKAKDEGWQQRALTSFIVHSDSTFGTKKEQAGENYHVYYNDKLYPNKITGNRAVTHKYGSIYMTPTHTFPFQNWFRMVMEFRLEEYHYCWTCGSDNVEEEIKYTRGGYEKFYYTCQACNQFWVKSHCQKGHTFIKRTNTYHRLREKGKQWHIECPTCRDILDTEG